jgi:long-subunit fatty acid transport protein
MALPATALAGGFEYGPQGLHAVGRGGAFTAKADDASAMYWNPSKLSVLKGTHLLVNLNTSLLSLDFDRFPAQKRKVSQDPETGALSYGDPVGDPIEFGRSSQNRGWFPMGISMALTSDFGLEDWGFGLSLNGPAAVGAVRYPGDKDAATRYSTAELDTMVAYITAAASYKYKEWFGFGLGLQYMVVPKLKYSLVIIGPAAYTNQNYPVNTINDLRADLSVSDWRGFTALLGAWAKPLPCLEFGFNARIIPVKVKAKGDVKLKGTENSVYESLENPIQVGGKLEFNMPATVQLGARYMFVRQDREIFDIEADFVWEQWSRMDAFRMATTERAEGPGLAIDPINIALERRWKDTYSVRLGGQWNAIPDWLTARLGGWWESATQPNAYTTVDLPGFSRFGIGFGLSTSIYGFEIGMAYAHVFQMDRTVEAGTGLIRQQLVGPEMMIEGYAVNEGKYQSSFDIITVGISVDWNKLISKGRGTPPESDLPPDIGSAPESEEQPTEIDSAPDMAPEPEDQPEEVLDWM